MTTPRIASDGVALCDVENPLGLDSGPCQLEAGHAGHHQSDVTWPLSDAEKIVRLRALCHRDGYTTWDADEKLPNPPYKPDDPAVVAWEKVHGHDFRLKCYAEYGCQLLIDPEEILAVLEG